MHESLTTIEEPEVELEGQASRPVLEGHLADEGVLHVGVQREADDGNFFLFDEGLDHGEVGLGLQQTNLCIWKYRTYGKLRAVKSANFYQTVNKGRKKSERSTCFGK